MASYYNQFNRTAMFFRWSFLVFRFFILWLLVFWLFILCCLFSPSSRRCRCFPSRCCRGCRVRCCRRIGCRCIRRGGCIVIFCRIRRPVVFVRHIRFVGFFRRVPVRNPRVVRVPGDVLVVVGQLLHRGHRRKCGRGVRLVRHHGGLRPFRCFQLQVEIFDVGRQRGRLHVLVDVRVAVALRRVPRLGRVVLFVRCRRLVGRLVGGCHVGCGVRRLVGGRGGLVFIPTGATAATASTALGWCRSGVNHRSGVVVARSTAAATSHITTITTHVWCWGSWIDD